MKNEIAAIDAGCIPPYTEYEFRNCAANIHWQSKSQETFSEMLISFFGLLRLRK